MPAGYWLAALIAAAALGLAVTWPF